MKKHFNSKFAICLFSIPITLFISCDGENEPDTDNIVPVVSSSLSDLSFEEGFGSETITISQVFSDADGDQLSFEAVSSNSGVIAVDLDGQTLTLTEEGIGTSTITITADDGQGGSVSDSFSVIVEEADEVEVVTISFGTNTGNSIEVDGWTTVSEASGYVVVISDVSTVADLADGDELEASTTYLGYGQQVVYSGSTSKSVEITLLEDSKTYFFKVFPYMGTFVFDKEQSVQESATTTCEISSTTISEVCFEITAEYRVISSNQYPSHAVGNFPNADPTAIQITRSLDLTPAVASNVTYVYNETSGPTPMNKNFYQFGIATNGVEFHPMGLKPWTNPDTGEENWKWQEQVTQEGQTDLDAYGAHVTSQGNYHYHGDIVGLAEDEDGTRHSGIYGFAGDGFPIYYKYGYVTADESSSGVKELLSSYRLKSGTRTGTGTSGKDYPSGSYDGTYIQDYEFVEGLGDLDECNGRTGATPEFPDGTYYYVITSDFPVTPNCFAGTPDQDWVIGK